MKNTVLIVDDSNLYREMLRTIIEKEGYKTELCEDGEQALQRIREKSDEIFFILLDLYMPGIDGISVLGNFRHHHPHIPVVVISGSEDADDEATVHKLGARSFLSKKLRMEQLQAALRDLMNELRKAA